MNKYPTISHLAHARIWKLVHGRREASWSAAHLCRFGGDLTTTNTRISSQGYPANPKPIWTAAASTARRRLRLKPRFSSHPKAQSPLHSTSAPQNATSPLNPSQIIHAIRSPQYAQKPSLIHTFLFLYLGVILFLTPLLSPAQDSVSTLAGIPQITGTNNGTGTNALLGDPTAIVMDATGNYYFTDTANHAIRKITTNGVVTTFAGKLGIDGSANGTGTNAQFYLPNGLAFDKSGNLYVSDTGNNLIRKITPSAAVSTFAGIGGYPAFQDGATGSAQFSSPLGIAVWTNGNIFIADSGNHCIREISNGAVSTFAGTPQIWGTNDATGTNAQFNAPCGLAFDARGNLFVSDANNNTIRKITTNAIVTTFAGLAGADGSADGPLANARFHNPAQLVFDTKGNLFVADSYNQTIREISTNGFVSTVSGVPGVPGSSDGTNGTARFYNPYGLVIATNGSLIVADAYNQTIRVVLVPFNVSLQIVNATHITTLAWDTVIGKNYQPQYQTNLSTPWLNLGPALTATNLTTSITDTYTTSTHFYRVLQVN